MLRELEDEIDAVEVGDGVDVGVGEGVAVVAAAEELEDVTESVELVVAAFAVAR